MTHKTWILRSKQWTRETADAFTRAEGGNRTAPPRPTQLSMSVDIPSGLQVPETKKKSRGKIRLEGNV